jgi:molecular chaperone DnaK (HSP70)
VLQNWPHIAGQSKTPTVISYKSENPQDRRGPEVRWGADVKDTMTSCSWTKLLLDPSTETQQYDDPSLRNAGKPTLFHLPAGKSAQQVCQDFLTQVYRHVIHALRGHYPAHLDITPIEFYFTMPAIWPDQAQAATKAAARGAGFGSRHLDAIHMITEPEAAAIAALKEELSPGSPNAAQVRKYTPGRSNMVP